MKLSALTTRKHQSLFHFNILPTLVKLVKFTNALFYNALFLVGTERVHQEVLLFI